MSYENKCRICLRDDAGYHIFENIESKQSIHSKLFLCLNEKIENVEGYPQKICEYCMDTLDTVYKFVRQYKSSCKLLESYDKNKEKCHGDSLEIKIKHEDIELEIYKNEPLSDSDGLEPLDDLWELKTHNKKQDIGLLEVTAKLKNLKDINFKKKSVQKCCRKTGNIASSILEAEFDWNGESLRSSKSKPPKVVKAKPQKKNTLLGLTNPAKPKKSQSPILCDLCGDVFKSADRLRLHKENKHFNKESKCPHCSKICSSAINLRRHIKRQHGEKAFTCDSCGKGFAAKGMMAAHIRYVHLKKRPEKVLLPCDKCDRKFSNKKARIIHDRSAHTGLRPAVCNLCEASFYHEDYLKEHMRLHTGEAPFKCPICDRGYAQRGNMRSHIKHNHRLADLSSELLKTLKPRWFKYLKTP